MNKDFFTKPISFKNIDLKKIDFRQLKNKKEIIVGILIMIYVIIIVTIGYNLIVANENAKNEYANKEARYNALQNADSEEKIREDILLLENEKSELESKVVSITPAEFSGILEEFKKNMGISWNKSESNEEVTLRPESSEFENYDVYVVNIRKFSGTLEQVKNFLDYVDKYPKVVKIDSISVRKDTITGSMTGQLKLSFYFKKLTE